MTFMARQATNSGFRGSMTAGYNSLAHFTGYIQSTLGSLSPTAFLGGAIATLYDNGSQGILGVTGLSANPGQSSFTSITATGASGSPKTSASATYSYSSGAATWTWSTQFGFGNGATYPIVIR